MPSLVAPPAAKLGLSIRHRTVYRYRRSVGFAPHRVRLFPRSEPHLLVRERRFATNEGADVQYRLDLFDNTVAVCLYSEEADELGLDLSLELELYDKNPFHFVLDSHAVFFPFEYRPQELRVLRTYQQLRPGDRVGELPFWRRPSPVDRRPTVDALVELNRAVAKHIAYQRREEGPPLAPAETLERRRGACRDTAFLLACYLREQGLAARLASGYLCELGVAAEKRRAEGALHAWTEAYLPGAGWVGLDPTNGIWANHDFITTAVGLVPEDVAPITGTYYGRESVESTMEAQIEMTRL